MAIVKSAIFHDIVETSRLGQDPELMALLQHNTSTESPLYNEVQDLINGLHLREFDSFPISQHDAGLSEGPVEPRNQTRTDDLKVSSQEVPELTKKQRTMSFDLMQMSSGARRSPQVLLSKPPEAAVSNVNVVTQVTDLRAKGYTPVPTEKKITLKDKFSSYRDRFKLVNRAKSASQTKIVQNTEYGNPEPYDISKKPESNGALKGRNGSLRSRTGSLKSRTGSLKSRIGSLKSRNGFVSTQETTHLESDSPRPSLVRRILPLYIKKQLPTKDKALATNRTQGDGPLESPPKSHHHSDIAALPSPASSIPSHRNMPEAFADSESAPLKTNESGTIDYSFGHTNNGSTISEADKEYILPSLFNRFLDYGENDTLENESDGSLSEDDEGDEDDEDDYLFNSHAV